MPRHGERPADRARAGLLALRDDPRTPEGLAAIRKGLAATASMVVEVAAQLVGEAELEELAPLLAPAFARLLVEPIKRDPGCRAKTAIAVALCKLRYAADEVYLTGVRHRQLEPVFGGREDTAVMLRGQCAVGLALVGHPDGPVAIAELLADPEWGARAAAARALAAIPVAVAEPLLRHKVAAGDREPQVLGECFRSLLAVAPAASRDVVAGFLAGRDEACSEQAALALGESRVEGAFAALRRHVEETALAGARRVALLAIAMLRSDEARAFLLETVRAAGEATAAHALDALAIERHDRALGARVLAAAAARQDDALLSKASELFDARA